jgi:hypothetical protein
MYESCFVNADQALELLVVVMTIVMLGLVAALHRQTGSARHYRAQFLSAATSARIFKRELDQARTELLFPDRKDLRHG